MKLHYLIMREFIDEFKTKLLNSRLASWWTIWGCWDYEIEKLENHFDIKLPAIYRKFLSKMGRKAGKLYQGTDIFYDYVFDNREGLENVLEGDNYPFELESSVFVFSSHQGYIFHFFDVRESAVDPPVYVYKEGDLQKERINESFSSFLLDSLEEEKRNQSNL